MRPLARSSLTGIPLPPWVACLQESRSPRGIRLPHRRVWWKHLPNTCGIVQAEDELAALGMAIGAGWAGARSMTSTAGPGISLMNEFIGLAYYAEVPVVIFDITRVGPS